MLAPYRPENVFGEFAGFEARDAAGKPLLRAITENGRHFFEARDAKGEWRRYAVDYTIGSKWQQAYATRTPSGDLHVLPLQYNALEKKWINYWRMIDPPGSPRAATLAVLLVLPPLMIYVFQKSEQAVGNWLGRGFDADTAMLESINSGRFADSPTGRYLETLRQRFQGPVVADLLCYLRLHTELALRAKGVLMMRENGFDVPVDDATRDKFAEMDYLESSIGKTGLLALKPMLHMSHKDLWQLHMLGK